MEISVLGRIFMLVKRFGMFVWKEISLLVVVKVRSLS